jgi:prepilin-type N-terminal cleavage/methylation domain-containing protein
MGNSLMTNDKGFTLIEVLISTLILALAILTVNGAFKQFVAYQGKMARYENLYTSVLSIRDQIASSPLVDGAEGRGSINGVAYEFRVVEKARRRNFEVDMLAEAPDTRGSFELTLFQITLTVDGRDFEFLQTRFKKA